MKNGDKNDFHAGLKYDASFMKKIEELLDQIEEHPEILNKMPLKKLKQLDKLLDISIENTKKRSKIKNQIFYKNKKKNNLTLFFFYIY